MTFAWQVRMACPSGIGAVVVPPPRASAPDAAGGVDDLFAAHAAELRRYAQRIVRTRDAAEDVVQDVFLRLWLRRDSLELGGAIRSYLFTSTRARAIDAVSRARREARRARHPAAAAAGALDEGAAAHVAHAAHAAHAAPAWEPDAEDVAEPGPPGDAIARAVAQVLDAMPPRQRAVATRRLRDRRGTADIARELGISPRTVEAHVARATKTLRAELPTLLASHADAPMTRRVGSARGGAVTGASHGCAAGPRPGERCGAS